NIGLTATSTVPTEWKSHVLATTASFSADSQLIPLLSGGLTHHAAHHLRPTASRRELRDLHNQLRCAAEDQTHPPLIEFTTFRSGLRGHITMLRQLGSAPAESSSCQVHETAGSSR